MYPDHSAYVRKCLADFETKDSKDPNKRAGCYAVIALQNHADLQGYNSKGVAAAGILLVPAAQAIVATIGSQCQYLLNGGTEKIHVLEALEDYTKKYYKEYWDGISGAFEKAYSYVR